MSVDFFIFYVALEIADVSDLKVPVFVRLFVFFEEILDMNKLCEEEFTLCYGFRGCHLVFLDLGL